MFVNILFAVVAAVFAFLYLDMRQNYRKILSRSVEQQAIPEVLNYDNDFDGVTVAEEADQKLLATLRELFEKDEVFLDKNLSIDSLAKQAGTGKARLSRLINEVFHCNFPTFLSNYRVTRAVEMFNDPANDIYTVEAIGESCGFNNRQAFHSSFKKRIGMPPSKFRKLIKEKHK